MTTFTPSHERPSHAWRSLLSVTTVVAVFIGLLGWSNPAAAEAIPEAPAARLDASMPPTTLFGRDVSVKLTASSATESDAFNLTFDTTIPADVAYVAGTTQVAGQATTDPSIVSQDDGTSVLVWANVSDLLTGASSELEFSLRPDTTVYAVGDPIDIAARAAVSIDPRMLAVTDPLTNAAGSTTTRLTPFDLTKDEASAESELLRGIDDHHTTFILNVQNNMVSASTNFAIVDHLPAGIEFLGCQFHASTEPPCVTPANVSTVTTDPDGDGPLNNDVYTRVEWDSDTLSAALGSADLTPGASFSIGYTAGIPLRRNVQADLAAPTANLDNNTGTLTADEELMIGHARAFGDFADAVPSIDDDTEDVISEDVSVHLSTSTGTFTHDSSSTWTLLVESGQYTARTEPIVVTEVVPDGLDVIATEPALDAGFPVTNADGTINLQWTLAGFDAPNSIATISFDTITRSTYRSSETPVAARDAWTSTAQLSTLAAIVTADDGSTTELTIPDASATRQRSAGPTISKEVAAPLAAANCGDGSKLVFNSDAAGPFGPGDRVCWRLTVALPEDLDVLGLVVEDYLPAGFTYDSHNSTSQDGIEVGSGFTADGPVLRWDLGNVSATARVFRVVVQTTVEPANEADPADLIGNLMKVRHTNTSGAVFQLRDEAHAEWGEPVLDLVSGIIDVNDVTVPGAPADDIQIEAGDIVTSQVEVSNTGNVVALDVSVRHELPADITCDQISAISNAGACDASDRWIQWDALGIEAASTLMLGYDLEVRAGITAAVTLGSTAGVRSYQSNTNANTRFTYVPADNIDPELTSNTTPAHDTWSIHTARPTIAAARTTSVNESGNNRVSQATIGETVSFSFDVTLPKGTTLYGPLSLSNTLGSRFDLVEASVVATLDGGALPSRWAVSDDGNNVTVESPNGHTVDPDSDETIRITFDAAITDVAANARPSRLANTLRLTWANDRGDDFKESASTRTQIVEPDLLLSKTHDDADSIIQSGQTYRYTVAARNGSERQTSTAHDVVILDTVAPQLVVLDTFGQPVVDGATVGTDAGIWNAQTRTIRWPGTTIAPGTAVSFGYDVQAAAPLVASSSVSGAVHATATSLAGATAGERTAESATSASVSGYDARATDVAEAVSLSINTEVITETATIGESVDVTIAVTLPANTIGYDVMIIDEIPAGLIYESLLSVRCDQGSGSCSPDLGSPEVLENGTDVGFFLGDLTSPADADRIITITYRAVVDNSTEANAPATLANRAAAMLNIDDSVDARPAVMPRRDSFDSSTAAVTDAVQTVEPTLGITKDTETPRGAPGSTLTYSVVVTNSESPSSGPAHDITVTDAPDVRLTNFADTTVSTDVTLVDGDHTDGSLSWLIPGPLLPGASVTITYSLTVPQGMDWSDESVTGREVLNTADVSAYHGVADREQAAHPDRSYRTYDDVDQITVGVELDLASVTGRVWDDADMDHLSDADERGLEAISVVVTYLGDDAVLGGGDDEVARTQTGFDGIWTVSGLPGGNYIVQVDSDSIPEGFVATYDMDNGADSPTGTWTGRLAENDNVIGIVTGFGAPVDEGPTTGVGNVGNVGDVWIVALKPNGTAYLRMRQSDRSWSRWYQQGPAATWASMSVNTDSAGNVWVVGVKLSGEAYVRTKQANDDIRAGWSNWYRQGSRGWASMSLGTDPAGNVWVVGVKSNGLAYARVKNAGSAVNQSWSRWVPLGSFSWSGIAIATDDTGQLWLAGVTREGSAYVLRRAVGGDMISNWSSWLRQGSGSDWDTMDLATDSENSLWLTGVKESGTAYLRQKVANTSLSGGWSSWLQLGGAKSWSSMTLTVDGADSLWIAGVKQSGTAYVRMKCICVGIANGWSGWMQQGASNSWDTLEVVNDPANRVLLAGMKLGGTAFTRTKANTAGLRTDWSGWTQHAGANSWDSFSAHSDSWVGIHPPRTPSLETRDAVWIASAGWVSSTNPDGQGLLYWC